MFLYRGLFAAVTISLASIVLADVLVQPGYEHQSNSNSHNSQSIPQYWINSLTEQHRMGQLPNQESTSHFPRLQSVRSVFPYEEPKESSHRVGYYPYRLPYHHNHDPRAYHPYSAKIGSNDHTRPSEFVGYRQPGHGYSYPQVHHHHRYRRSLESDPTNTEANETATVAHDNDVASKSPLTDAKHSKAIDSLLPEHEPTDPNDKRVENRQTKNIEFWKRYLAQYPQNVRFPEARPIGNMNPTKYMLSNAASPLSMSDSSAAYALNTPRVIKPNAPEKVFSQRNEQDCTQNDETASVFTNNPSIRPQPFLEDPSDDYDDYDSKYRTQDTPSYTVIYNLLRKIMEEYYPKQMNSYTYFSTNQVRPKDHRTYLQIGNKLFQISTNAPDTQSRKSTVNYIRRDDKIRMEPSELEDRMKWARIYVDAPSMSYSPPVFQTQLTYPRMPPPIPVPDIFPELPDDHYTDMTYQKGKTIIVEQDFD